MSLSPHTQSEPSSEVNELCLITFQKGPSSREWSRRVKCAIETKNPEMTVPCPKVTEICNSATSPHSTSLSHSAQSKHELTREYKSSQTHLETPQWVSSQPMTDRALTMLASKLLLLGLLAICSVSALSRELVTDVDAHRTKVRHNCWAWCEVLPHCATLLHLPTILNPPPPTPRDRPSLHPLVHALMERCNWSPTHKTSSGGVPAKENGCPTGET